MTIRGDAGLLMSMCVKMMCDIIMLIIILKSTKVTYLLSKHISGLVSVPYCFQNTSNLESRCEECLVHVEMDKPDYDTLIIICSTIYMQRVQSYFNLFFKEIN